jgi:4-amino-4-deoxy-L-arabinose transferase-like glycosyltransferase
MATGFEGLVFTLLYLAAQALTVWAFVDALIRPANNFVAMGKLTKPAWLGITGLAAVILFLTKNPIALLGLPAIIAAVVYLVDVRPAVRGLPRGNSW